MDSMVAARKGTLVRDLLIFQAKLVIDGLKDILLIQVSVGAVVIDLLLWKPGRPLLFYKVLSWSERFDLWINVYSASRNAEMNEDGLFGESAAGLNTMLGRLEELVRQRVEPAPPPVASKI